MERRVALKSVVAALTGGLVATTGRSLGSQSPSPPQSALSGAQTFVEIGDATRTRISVRDWGRGRPIVFVAPWALCSDWWDYHMTMLAARGWRSVAFDRRGHGRSDEPGRGYDFDTLADDLAAVLDSRDLEDVVLVGHSMGGAEVVRYLTRHHSRRVTRVVLIAPTTPYTLKSDDNPAGATREGLAQSRESLARDFHHQIAKAAPDFFGATKNQVSTEAMDWWTRMIIDRCPLRVMLTLHQLMTETDFRPELRTITTPTLIVHGDSDISTPLERTSRRTHALIAGSQLTIYENAAHGLPFTHADRLLGDILTFAR
jgi:non-heme chloroperoxidase